MFNILDTKIRYAENVILGTNNKYTLQLYTRFTCMIVSLQSGTKFRLIYMYYNMMKIMTLKLYLHNPLGSFVPGSMRDLFIYHPHTVTSVLNNDKLYGFNVLCWTMEGELSDTCGY